MQGELSSAQRLALAKLKGLCPAQPSQLLASGVPALDRFLGGGLPWGKLVEWGLPQGQEGWRLLLPFVAQASQTGLCLWLGQGEDRKPFPPAWFAAGVKPESLRLLESAKPLQTTKEVFPHPLLKLILLDAPQGLRSEDLAFLAAQARQANKLILLLRPYFLSPKQGNVWAALRLNAWRRGSCWMLRGVKGAQGDLRLLPKDAA